MKCENCNEDVEALAPCRGCGDNVCGKCFSFCDCSKCSGCGEKLEQYGEYYEREGYCPDCL